LRDVIRRLDLNAKKALGQNFIHDLNLTRRIARACGDLTSKLVVEVGPGPGGLTRGLLSEGANRVLAVEIDPRCIGALEEIKQRWPGRLDIHVGDALEVAWSQEVSKLIGATGDQAVIISNLPYGVATKLLVGWLSTSTWPPWYSAMGLMFQREVAERIVASPATKAYGRLSVLSQWCCDTRIELSLPPEAFSPPPKVASAVVVFTPKPERIPDCSVSSLSKVTAAAFGQRRKMLRTSLKQLTPFPELLLDKAAIDPRLRAEDVDVAGFARLAQALD
jgi:16S rRNA (adenine1518-N6/adenine1519-N6)-dimethyltransferase